MHGAGVAAVRQLSALQQARMMLRQGSEDSLSVSVGAVCSCSNLAIGLWATDYEGAGVLGRAAARHVLRAAWQQLPRLEGTLWR